MANLQPASNTTAADTFHPFPRLPRELRNAIWMFASFIPRNVDIWACNPDGHYDENKGIWTQAMGSGADGHVNLFYYNTMCAHPAILHTSQEARAEGIKHYELSFGTRLKERNFLWITPKQIYINFDADRICLLQSYNCMQSGWGNVGSDFFQQCKRNGTRYLALKVSKLRASGTAYPDSDNREFKDYIRSFFV